jgi:hypothetical protein
MHKTSWLRILLLIPVFVGSLAVVTSAYSQRAGVAGFASYDEQRERISWKGVAELEYGISLGPNRPGPAAPFAIGFSHLGYSEPDPDGQAATLTLAVKPATRLGGPGDSSIRVVEFVPRSLDVSLQANPAEEDRLRALLKLPRPVTTADSVAPFQIRWKAVPGTDLHGWLVGSQGLRWKLSGIVRTRLAMLRTERIEPSCVDAWWSKAVRVQGGLTQDLFWLATADLALAGCFQVQVASRASTVLTAEYERNFIRRLHAGGAQVSLEQVKQAGAPLQTTTESEVEIPFAVTFSPGDFLLSRPEYVKDLSGDSVGLDALLGKN